MSMEAYQDFAIVYDRFMDNVPYDAWRAGSVSFWQNMAARRDRCWTWDAVPVR